MRKVTLVAAALLARRLADKLRADAAKVSTRTTLPDLLARVAARMDEEHRMLVALFEIERSSTGAPRPNAQLVLCRAIAR